MFLYRAIVAACKAEGMTPSAWAVAHKLTAGVMSNIKRGQRPAASTLKILSAAWKNPEHGLICIQSYFWDELRRVGLTTDQISVAVQGKTVPDRQLEACLQTLSDYMRRIPDLRCAIIDLAAILPHSAFAPAADTQIRRISRKRARQP